MLKVDAPMTDAEFERLVNEMSDESQEHFKLLVQKLVVCYTNEDAKALVLFSGARDSLLGIVTVNCNEMDAMRLVMSAKDLFGFINTADAPPKELLN